MEVLQELDALIEPKNQYAFNSLHEAGWGRSDSDASVGYSLNGAQKPAEHEYDKEHD